MVGLGTVLQISVMNGHPLYLLVDQSQLSIGSQLGGRREGVTEVHYDKSSPSRRGKSFQQMDSWGQAENGELREIMPYTP